MKRLIHIQADHPIFQYIDKYHHDMDEVNKLVTELKRLNYENIKIDGKEIPEDEQQTKIS